MDQFTETTRTSYLGNLGNSFKGILVGIILLFVSIGLLWWNEGRSVEQAAALDEMAGQIVTLPNTTYNPEYEKKPVLAQGNVTPLKKVQDTVFGVTSDGLILRRNVEMYQWKENKESKSEEKVGGGTETTTTYNYIKEWSSSAINSSSFKHPTGHHNPPMNYKGETFTTDAKIGDYYLSQSMVSNFGASRTFDGLSQLPKRVGVTRNYKSFLYIGHNPQTPRIGDVKITYSYAPAGAYSIAAAMQNKSLVRFNTSNGKSFAFIRSGTVSAEQIFKQEHDANSTLTWILRGVGLFLMFMGFSLIMGPISTIVKIIPFFQTIVGAATGLIALVLTLILGSIVIALAWFASRPILSLIIIGVGVGIAVALTKMGAKKVAAAPAAEPATAAPSSATPPPRETPATPPPREE